MTRVGVMGGTFDPFHLGHLAVVRLALECARLDELVLVPAALPPHRGPAAASAADRLEMARLGVENEPRVTVSAMEVDRSGPSYTADTLRELAAARPGAELYLVLGWDAARELGTWSRPAEVLHLARLVILGRPGAGAPSQDDLTRAGVNPERVTICPGETPDVSATAVRAAAAAGRGLAGLLPPAVARHVAERALYRPRAEAE